MISLATATAAPVLLLARIVVLAATGHTARLTPAGLRGEMMDLVDIVTRIVDPAPVGWAEIEGGQAA